MFNYVQISAIFHLLIQKCLGSSFFSRHTVESDYAWHDILNDFKRKNVQVVKVQKDNKTQWNRVYEKSRI